ncbi:MAG TPA: CHRD domain-containing protein [Burkholderiaceae bacterium]|nr:CHRD domain-containing protein [Burkholderiaceae bacterium]
MNNTQRVARFALVGAAFVVVAGMARADTVQARLSGFQEVPSVSTVASGRFKAKIDEHAGSIFWELEFEGLQADATQAHIHFGQRHTNGGITVWLCSNLASPPTPAGTQRCPLRAGTINGAILAANVVGPGGVQQLPAGGFEQLLRAMRAGATYANVHTTASPGGEIRGQIRRGQKDD